MKITLQIKRNTTCSNITNKEIEKLIRQIEKVIKRKEDLDISLVFVDNTEIKKINKKWRKKDSPTDVLSFALSENVGEIFISCEKAKIQALQYKVTQKNEIKRLIIHGCLHLLGYTHNQMKKIDKKILYV